MMRGVSWALASCTARSSEDTAKTTKVNMDEERASRAPCAPSGVKPNHGHPVRSSSQRTTRTAAMAAIIHVTGTTQNEERRKWRRR
jgi:hypothetical protein